MTEDTKAIYKYFNITYRFHINMLIASPFNMNKYKLFSCCKFQLVTSIMDRNMMDTDTESILTG